MVAQTLDAFGIVTPPYSDLSSPLLLQPLQGTGFLPGDLQVTRQVGI